jgi:hypothetical protein
MLPHPAPAPQSSIEDAAAASRAMQQGRGFDGAAVY